MLRKLTFQSKTFLLRCITPTAKKKGNFVSCFMEVLLWAFLLLLAAYLYLPGMFSIFGNNSKSEPPVKKLVSKGKPRTVSGYRLELTMQIVLGSGSDIDAVLVDSLNSQQFIVPVELRRKSEMNSKSEKFQQAKIIEAQNISKSFLDGYIQSVKIKCSAPFPIEFAYEGSGMPIFDTILVEKRNIKVLEDMTQSFYIGILDFGKSHLEEGDSGKYICQSVRKIGASTILKPLKSAITNKIVEDQVSIKMFVPGEKKFIHEHILEGNSDSSPIVVHHNVAVDGKEISLPCGVSDPATEVTLYHMVGTNYPVEMPSEEGPILRDDVDGFRIPVELVKHWSEINLICKAHHAGKTLREIAFKIKLNAFISHISPPYSQVTLDPSQLPIQVFKCEAEEPLMLKWLDGATATRISNRVPAAGKEMYSVSFIATPTQFGNSSVARFECSRKRDGVVIHTWEWIKDVEGGTKPFLRLNEKQKELSCCVKNSEPRLQVEACSSMLECKLKASLQSKIASSSWNNIRRRNKEVIIKGSQIVGPGSGNNNDNSCAVWKLSDEFQAGLVMCTQVRNNSGSDHFRDVELPPVYLRWNDDVVGLRNGHFSKPLESLIRMEMTTGADTMDNGRLLNHKKIECYASSMVFAKGFRWRIFMHSGEVFENVQLKTLWGHKYGGIGVLSYQEEYLPQQASYIGVLQLRTSAYVKPFLKINSKEDKFARLELRDKIETIQCQAPMWNDTSVWVTLNYNKSLLI